MTNTEKGGVLATIIIILLLAILLAYSIGYKAGNYIPAYPDLTLEYKGAEIAITAFKEMLKDTQDELASTTQALNFRISEVEFFGQQMTLHCKTQGFNGDYLLTTATSTDPLFCDLTATSTEQ